MTNIIVSGDTSPREEVLKMLGDEAEALNKDSVQIGDELYRLWNAIKVCLICIDILNNQIEDVAAVKETVKKENKE